MYTYKLLTAFGCFLHMCVTEITIFQCARPYHSFTCVKFWRYNFSLTIALWVYVCERIHCVFLYVCTKGEQFVVLFSIFIFILGWGNEVLKIRNRKLYVVTRQLLQKYDFTSNIQWFTKWKTWSSRKLLRFWYIITTST